MAKNETRPLKPSVIADDREVYIALKAIPNYAPANQAYTVAAIDAVHDELEAAQDAAVRADAAAAAARDNLVAVQWEMHNKILGAKVQVEAQFGSSSNEIQSMKRKKKTEYKKPAPRAQKKSG